MKSILVAVAVAAAGSGSLQAVEKFRDPMCQPTSPWVRSSS